MRKSDRPPNWAEIRDEALTALAISKDLRLLAHLGAAILRTDGIPAFAETLGVASHWLAVYSTQVYPAGGRGRALSSERVELFLPIRWPSIDGLRRTPLVSSRQHGRFSLRDIEIVGGTGDADRRGGAAGRETDQRGVRRHAARGAASRCSGRSTAR